VNSGRKERPRAIGVDRGRDDIAGNRVDEKSDRSGWLC